MKYAQYVPSEHTWKEIVFPDQPYAPIWKSQLFENVNRMPRQKCPTLWNLSHLYAWHTLILFQSLIFLKNHVLTGFILLVKFSILYYLPLVISCKEKFAFDPSTLKGAYLSSQLDIRFQVLHTVFPIARYKAKGEAFLWSKLVTPSRNMRTDPSFNSSRSSAHLPWEEVCSSAVVLIVLWL